MTMPSPAQNAIRNLLTLLDEVETARAVADPASQEAMLRAAARQALADPAFTDLAGRALADLHRLACDETRAVLIGAFDERLGVLPDDAALPADAVAHLATCADCRSFRAEIAGIFADDDELAAVGAAIDDAVAEHVRRQVRRLIRFSGLSEAAAERRRAVDAPLELAGRRTRGEGDAVVLQWTADDPDERWTLLCTAFLEPGAIDETPRYKVQIELRRFQAQSRWRDARWTLNVWLDDEEVAATQDRRGIWELAIRPVEADLSRLGYEVDLLDDGGA